LIGNSQDPRLEECWRWASSADLSSPKTKKSVAILSYPDDEGVRLNNGRPGASEGPARILYYLGRMIKQSKTPEIIVLGNRFPQLRLSERHEAAEENLHLVFKKGYRAISLGGGHDYGFPDAAAFYRSFKCKILNIDAHMDVRPVVDQKLNSGTAFWRFAEKYKGSSLISWGLQEHCNAESQKDWARSKKIKLLSYTQAMPKIPGRVGLSICLDAFAGIRGVSAPSVLGLSPEQGAKVIASFGKRSPWLGLYESAPRYDPQTEDSARLAAILAYRFIHI